MIVASQSVKHADLELDTCQKVIDGLDMIKRRFSYLDASFEGVRALL